MREGARRRPLTSREGTPRRSLTSGRPGKLLLLFLLAAGLPTSLFAVLRVIRPNSDTATPVVVAGEVARHGLVALQAWHYTQDNWLLSIILPDLALYAVVGSAPWIVLTQGWLLLAACCGLTALLARRMMPGPVASCLGALLLFAHPDSLGPDGFLADPVSHGATMAWGLLGLLLGMRWLERGGIAGIGAAACLVIAGTSDPWAKASLLLPLLLACLACAASRSATVAMRRRQSAAAGFALLCLLGGTRWFGLLGFLPSTRFETATAAHLPAHAGAALEVLSSYFSVLPGHGTLASDLTLALIAALLAACARRRSRDLSVLPLFCMLSCAGTAAAYILSDLDVGLPLGRMMLNDYYLLPLLIAAGLRRAGQPWRLLGCIVAASSVASSLIETTRLPPAPDPDPPGGLYAFLEQHGLAYGYGPYWPTQANASGWITRGRVVIRPLEAAGALPLQARTGGQVFPWWYEPGDVASADGRVFFVAIPDRETCTGTAACVSAAIHSFGVPDRRLDWGGIPVLVWDHPVLGHEPDAAARRAAPLLRPGATIGVTTAVLWTGWSPPGANGAWSLGERSQVILRLEPGPPAGLQRAGLHRLCATLRATGRRGRPAQRVRVLLDGRPDGEWQVAAGVAHRYCVVVQPVGGSAILTLERPRGHGWRYRRDVPGVALQALGLTSGVPE